MQATIPEQWAAVKGFEGLYEVSTMGRVRRLSIASAAVKRIHPRRNYEPKTVTPVINAGYAYVTFSKIGTKASRRGIHSTVLETFVGPRPEGYYACHRDGNRADNSLKNLKWATPKENQKDRVVHGRGQHGESNGSVKLTDAQVREIRQMRIETGWPYHVIAQKFGSTKANIHLICTGKSRIQA